MARIETMERLRELIPAPSPTASAKILDHIDEQAHQFVRQSPFLIMTTMGGAGLEASPKGDVEGFVEILDDRTLLIPERNGNQLAMGLSNILRNGQIALLFFRPRTNETFRICGRASLLDDPDICERLAARGKPAVLAIRVEIERAFFHCGRAVLRSGLWDPDSWAEPWRVSIPRVIANAMGRPDMVDTIERISAERDNDL